MRICSCDSLLTVAEKGDTGHDGWFLLGNLPESCQGCPLPSQLIPAPRPRQRLQWFSRAQSSLSVGISCSCEYFARSWQSFYQWRGCYQQVRQDWRVLAARSCQLHHHPRQVTPPPPASPDQLRIATASLCLLAEGHQPPSPFAISCLRCRTRLVRAR